MTLTQAQADAAPPGTDLFELRPELGLQPRPIAVWQKVRHHGRVLAQLLERGRARPGGARAAAARRARRRPAGRPVGVTAAVCRGGLRLVGVSGGLLRLLAVAAGRRARELEGGRGGAAARLDGGPRIVLLVRLLFLCAHVEAGRRRVLDVEAFAGVPTTMRLHVVRAYCLHGGLLLAPQRRRRACRCARSSWPAACAPSPRPAPAPPPPACAAAPPRYCIARATCCACGTSPCIKRWS